eukprot:g23721.t1
MERVIPNAIKQHLLSNSLLTNTQFGFCEDHIAHDFITALVQTWTEKLNSRGEVRVTAIDIKTKCGVKKPEQNYGNSMDSKMACFKIFSNRPVQRCCYTLLDLVRLEPGAPSSEVGTLLLHHKSPYVPQ